MNNTRLKLTESQAWLPNEPIDIQGSAWLAPNKDVHFFCDLHADAGAFVRSLKLSGLITEDSSIEHITLTETAQHAQIIIGGDCFDKGPSNLDLFKVLGNLRAAHSDLILLSGNHDLRVLAGIIALDHQDDIRQSHFVIRMGRKTVALFKEIFDQYHLADTAPTLSNQEAIATLSPNDEWFEKFAEYADIHLTEKQIEKEFKQIRKKQVDMFAACAEVGLTPNQLHQAIDFAKTLFIEPNGEYSWFFEEFKLVHRNGSYLFCHAGLDDSIAEYFHNYSQPCELINDMFQNTLRNGKIFEIYYSAFGNIVRTKYRNKDFPLTSKGTQHLKDQGIFALVNGHRAHLDGQKLYVRAGILNFECDTELNSNCRKKQGLNHQGESATIFSINGTVSALCSDLYSPKIFTPNKIR